MCSNQCVQSEAHFSFLCCLITISPFDASDAIGANVGSVTVISVGGVTVASVSGVTVALVGGITVASVGGVTVVRAVHFETGELNI